MVKRVRHEGSIFQRQDGRRCGLISLGWEAGRRKRKYFFAGSAAKVQEQLLKHVPIIPEVYPWRQSGKASLSSLTIGWRARSGQVRGHAATRASKPSSADISNPNSGEFDSRRQPQQVQTVSRAQT